MPETTRKPPEVIQAQLATFAAEHVEDYYDSGHIFKNLGNIAAGKAGDISRITERYEYRTDENGESMRVPEGTELKVATTDEYTNFLRSVGGSRYEAIQLRADMLKNYEHFEPTVTKLKSELADPTTRKQHPSFLGNGSNAMAFSIMEGDKSYAVRVPVGIEANPQAIDSHLGGAVLGKGIPHLEQIVAASYEDGVTVAEVMPGKEVGQLSAQEIKAISDKQLGELVDTLVAVSERGIEIDPKPSNFFYDPKEGFGIVDYHSSKVAGKQSADQNLGTIVGWMTTPISNMGSYGKPYVAVKTTSDYAQDLEFGTATLGVLKRYRAVVVQKLSSKDQEVALVQIDKKIQSSQEYFENLSNPTWVAERVAQDQEHERQRAENTAKQTSPIEGWIKLDTV